VLRALLALLLLANGLFLAWTQGWLAPTLPPPHAGEREPQRLAAQINPEQVRVLTPQAASDAIRAAQDAQRRCLEAGPFDAVSRVEAESLLAAAGLEEGRWQRVAPAPAVAGAGDPALATPPAPAAANAPAAAGADAALLLRVPDADPDEQARLRALSLPGAGFRPCPAAGG